MEASSPNLWNDPNSAQSTMRRLSRLNEEIALWSDLESSVDTLADLIDLSVETGDLSLEGQIVSEISELRSRLDRLEFNLALNGKYDRDAALLAIHSGAGGTESQDWAETLMRMYLRWGDAKGRGTRVLDLSPGEEAGIKSVTLEINGAWAYGYLKSERGVHRLVRLSPFDADHLRHTSFALVEVLPQAEDDIDLVIDPDDVKIDYFKSSGAGGQHVQKNPHGGKADSRSHRHSGDLSERTLTAPEPGDCHEGFARQASGNRIEQEVGGTSPAKG